ncbi:tetratricopeptide repeat protein [Cellulophaga fucicola]|uniref:tetratricopeptide repeat protein n=1 Tax=Cellulophaga fucicola TaxID=76595 RepID=UPI003EBF049F
MSTNNPIQQRINLLLQKWTIAINTPDVKIVRILSEHDEEDIVSTFFEYMLALDTEQEDFVMVLYEPFSGHETYSKHLLEEIEEEINQWNTAKIPENIHFKTIEWKPDYTLGSSKNAAQLLVKNLNNFANYLIPDQKTKVSIIIRMYEVGKNQACKWFEDLLEVETTKHLVFGISDTVTNRVFDKLESRNQKHIYTIYPQLNMDEALEELTALGDPSAAETPYRTSLVKLMNAVKNRKKDKIEEHAKICLTIATNELKKDSNWLSQIVTVYVILYNDQLGNKKYSRAIYFADKAVEAALLSKKVLVPEMSNRLIGQTHVGRGALLSLQKKWELALENYIVANEAYIACEDYVMQSETYRLCGWACEKTGAYSEASKHYIKAYDLVYKLSPEFVKGSTFPYILKKLINSTERLKYITDEKMDEDLIPIWGESWRTEVEKYGKMKKIK